MSRQLHVTNVQDCPCNQQVLKTLAGVASIEQMNSEVLINTSRVPFHLV